ncbi:MAG: pilus assembly protein, partial [Gammaproteobacteria bacterium]|nr:pilus assembly protein [Gammaproteobacteria bacterium]
FSHNEFNPDNEDNQMIQLWVLPDQPGEAAGYKVYQPKAGQRLQIYGGAKDQSETFYSQTIIEVAHLAAGQTLEQQGDAMAFLSKGSGIANGETMHARTLIRDNGLSFVAESDVQLILIYENKP